MPRWSRASFVFTFLFLLITLIICLYKADFINLTICAVAIHLLSNAKDSQPKHFRYLVAATILSFVYDIAWIILRGYDYVTEDEQSGNVETEIRKFTFNMVILGLCCKVMTTFVYWMASLRFEDIVEERA